ncbi:C40 family peptidase [Blastococcus sp. PRF04-17]|uniref:C40 family peptidase n=1 Tax=Blastococcus sp. PRF04-17 TaxID=2933797 RepID=UPI001FF2FC78|nr:C40 family peptidase [Blastococcus sp. PRF04-17]UOY02988.1 C40 family peptidase [Blastococcus sp. PRF04-17]
MATPHAVLPHALEQQDRPSPAHRTRPGHLGWLRSGLLLGATAALTLTVLPGTAGADPGEATTPAQAAAMVAEADHELEVVTEELNEAKVVLERQQAAVQSAQRAAAEAQAQLDALDGQIRQLARSAYTSEGLSHLDVILTSESADDLLHQMSTLDAIAGHTSDAITEVALAADEAESAQEAADAAVAEAQQQIEAIEVKQEDLEAKIADYKRQYAALTAPQREVVAAAHGGTQAQAVPTGVVAPSGAAQVAVDTALAQVGDAYVWGAGGPDAFDCSGLTQYAYSAAGVSLPHSSRSQSTMGTPVSVSELQPGDLLFYYSPTSHVAMYVGNGKMVHASTSSKPVMVVDFNSMSGFTHARRIAG